LHCGFFLFYGNASLSEIPDCTSAYDFSYPKLARGYTPPASDFGIFCAIANGCTFVHGAESNTAGHGNSPVLTEYALVNVE